MDARVLATLESGIICARTGGTFAGAIPDTIYLGAQQGEKMDTKPKDEKPTELDLEIAVFAAP
jgi:hypothetical protein